MITLKAIKELKPFHTIDHHIRSKKILLSVWRRPMVFNDRFAPAEYEYEVSHIGASGILSVRVNTPEEAWAKYKQAIA